MKNLITCLLLFVTTVAFTQNCDIMKKGTFKDAGDLDKTAYYEIHDGWMYDYSKNGSEYIKSEMEWTSDCEYTLTLKETNIDDLEIPIGTKLRVEIMKVEGDTITYQYLPEGVLKPRQLIKVDKDTSQ